MTIQELYNILQPLTQPLGTLCLFLLVSGCVAMAIVWFVRKFWMYIAAAGLLALFVAIAGMSLNLM
jgi:hypothetical protein